MSTHAYFRKAPCGLLSFEHILSRSHSRTRRLIGCCRVLLDQATDTSGLFERAGAYNQDVSAWDVRPIEDSIVLRLFQNGQNLDLRCVLLSNPSAPWVLVA